MSVYEVDPIRDSRWQEFLKRDPRASVFHTPAWLEALSQSYGYEPVVLTTCSPRRELTNGAVFCKVSSWITGRRMVSLPFSDHCELLLEDAENLEEISSFLHEEMEREHLRYVEVRPLRSPEGIGHGFFRLRSLCFHSLDIRPNVDQLFEGLHRDCIRRKIRRARREALTYERGTSAALLRQFYSLFVMTRRRHGLPPSPFRWFEALTDRLGPALQVRIATKNDRPVAGVLTLTHKNVVYYKYGASDTRYNNLGGIPFLLWSTILESKADGLEQLDLGRCEPDNSGLIAFKDRWGSERSTLTYWSSPAGASEAQPDGWKFRLASKVIAHAPVSLRVAAGQVLYRHVG